MINNCGTKNKLVLASASPRRKDILKEFGYDFDVIPSNFDEKIESELSPCDYVTVLALSKVLDVYKKIARPTLGADTIVVYNDKIIGKPTSENNERELLEMLSGKTHKVYTGFALIKSGVYEVGAECSEVTFNELNKETIEKYTKSKLGMDKAGGYGVQDGFGLVKSVKGSLYNVIGLPIERIKTILDREKL